MQAWIARAFGLGAAIVDWRSTAILLAMRSAAGGLVWGLIILLMGGPGDVALAYIIFGTFVGMCLYAPLGIVFAGIARLFPIAGIVCLLPMMYMVAGDPVLWLARRQKPDLLPVEKFNIFNFNTLIFVINQEVVDTVRDGVTSEVGRAASSAIDRLSSFKRG
jgi:hypothetical protein